MKELLLSLCIFSKWSLLPLGAIFGDMSLENHKALIQKDYRLATKRAFRLYATKSLLPKSILTILGTLYENYGYSCASHTKIVHIDALQGTTKSAYDHVATK